jgi:hypothetical protein
MKGYISSKFFGPRTVEAQAGLHSQRIRRGRAACSEDRLSNHAAGRPRVNPNFDGTCLLIGCEYEYYGAICLAAVCFTAVTRRL